MSNFNQISPGFTGAKVWRFLLGSKLLTAATDSLKLGFRCGGLERFFHIVHKRGFFWESLRPCNYGFLFAPIFHRLKVITAVLISASVIGCGEKNFDLCTPDPSTVGEYLYADGQYRKSIKFYCSSGCEYLSPVSAHFETPFGYAFKSPTVKSCNSSANASSK